MGEEVKLSIVMTYYNQPDVLAWNLNMISTWGSVRWADTEVIIVDDGSMKYPLYDLITNRSQIPNLSVYRVTKDIPWNQCGARNLGAFQSKGQMILFLDIDHQADAWSLDTIVKEGVADYLDPCTWVTFDRLDSRDCKPLPPGKNIFLMRRKDFFTIGGYDEDLTGEYLQDRLFIWSAEKVLGPSKVHESARLMVLVNGGVKELDRKSYRNLQLIRDKMEGRVPMSTDMIRFQWEKVI